MSNVHLLADEQTPFLQCTSRALGLLGSKSSSSCQGGLPQRHEVRCPAKHIKKFTSLQDKKSHEFQAMALHTSKRSLWFDHTEPLTQRHPDKPRLSTNLCQGLLAPAKATGSKQMLRNYFCCGVRLRSGGQTSDHRQLDQEYCKCQVPTRWLAYFSIQQKTRLL